MILEIGAAVVLVASGFGLGRVKNPAKLAAAKAELLALEAKAIGYGVAIPGELLSAIAAVKAKLSAL